jgi:hypothetical protein
VYIYLQKGRDAIVKDDPSTKYHESLQNSSEKWYTISARIRKNDLYLLNKKLEMNGFKTFNEFVHDIKISIGGNSETNTSIIKIEKNNSGISGEHTLSPENENLSPYLDSLSPVSNELTPVENQDLSTKSNNSGDTGHTGDKSDYSMEDDDEEDNNHRDSTISKRCNCQDPVDHRIGHTHPFYFCIEHPIVP